MPFRYQAYGLILESEIELPLPESNRRHGDVCIRFDHVPEHLASATTRDPCFEIGPDELLFKVKEEIRILIRNGTEILLSASSRTHSKNLAIYVIGSGLGTILEQRQRCCFHASAISHEGQCYLFAGHSGAGKSTLSAALCHRGYSHYSDDVCPLFLDSGRLVSIQGYPSSKLWPDSLQRLGIPETPLPLIHSEENKKRYSWPPSNQTTTLPVAKLFILAPKADCDLPSITKLSPTEVINYCRRYRYRPQWQTSEKSQTLFFEILANIANKIPTFRIDRPTRTFQLEDLVRKTNQIIEPTLTKKLATR